VAIALAREYRAYRGEPAVSDGWLGRARRLLDGAGQTRERGWLALVSEGEIVVGMARLD
jgi:hypothetical protein